MSARLVVIAGPDQGKWFALPLTSPLVIGRGRTVDAQLADPHISRSHCLVNIERGRAVLKDLDSCSGVYVNDAKVQSHPLKPGDVIRLGSSLLRLELEDAVDANALADMVTLPPPPNPQGVPVLPPMPPVPTPAPARQPAVAPPPLPRPAVPPPPSLSVQAGSVDNLTGKTMAHFQIGSQIAPGKTGIVYRATDTREGKLVALKVFPPEFAKDEEEMQRFIRAMKTMLPLRHPHAVAILGAGRSGPFCWVSMELVEGRSLAPAVLHAASGSGDWRVAFRAILHVARALAYLHGQSILHRNIGPNNVLFRTADRIFKLGDLMTAKAQEGRLSRDVTQAGEIIGDLRFLSPEQTSGSGESNGRADLYSLGATAYALLTGRPPVEGKGPVDTILKIRQVMPPPPGTFVKGVPPAFDATVMKLLAKKPEERFQTAGELLGHLGSLAASGV